MSKQARGWFRGWPKRRSPQPRPFRPQVELLEDRLAPAVITVNTVDDNDVRDKEGNLTLREAILLTNGTLAKKALTNKERNQVQGIPGRPGIEDTIKCLSDKVVRTRRMGVCEPNDTPAI